MLDTRFASARTLLPVDAITPPLPLPRGPRTTFLCVAGTRVAASALTLHTDRQLHARLWELIALLARPRGSVVPVVLPYSCMLYVNTSLDTTPEPDGATGHASLCRLSHVNACEVAAQPVS